MKKYTRIVVFFLAILTFLSPIGALAATKKTQKSTTTKATVQNKKNTTIVKKTTQKKTTTVAKKRTKKKTVKHVDKIKTTVAPLIDPSNPPGGN